MGKESQRMQIKKVGKEEERRRSTAKEDREGRMMLNLENI